MWQGAGLCLGFDGDFEGDGFAVDAFEVVFDFGDGTGDGLFASGAGIFRFGGMVTHGTEGENETAFAMVVNERGDFVAGNGLTRLGYIHIGTISIAGRLTDLKPVACDKLGNLPRGFCPEVFQAKRIGTVVYRTTSKAKPFKYSVSGIIGIIG